MILLVLIDKPDHRLNGRQYNYLSSASLPGSGLPDKPREGAKYADAFFKISLAQAKLPIFALQRLDPRTLLAAHASLGTLINRLTGRTQSRKASL